LLHTSPMPCLDSDMLQCPGLRQLLPTLLNVTKIVIFLPGGELLLLSCIL